MRFWRIEYIIKTSDEFKEKVKQEVTGENSKSGNSPEEATPNEVNKAFYDAAKKATNQVIDKRQELENSGLAGKFMPVGKKSSVYKEDDSFDKIKKFKTTIREQ